VIQVPKPNASILKNALWRLRGAFAVVGIFSMVANLLMLTPTLYMLQVYDRVLVSRSELTLLAMSALVLFLFGMAAFSEWSRTRLLVRIGVKLDGLLSTRVFNASFQASLNPTSNKATRAFMDLTELRQFLTGQGVFALFDAPWTPIYIVVLFLLHPFLGWVAIGFAVLQTLLALLGHQKTVAPMQELQKKQADANLFLQTKLRNAEVLESMGMLGGLRRRWQQRQDAATQQHALGMGLTHRITAWSKFLRYSQQSLALGAGALLVIDGQITPGAMIAANVLMTRALAPIDLLVSTWRNLITASAAYSRLDALLAGHEERDPNLHRSRPEGELTLRQVSAGAAGRAKPILSEIDLQAQAGAITVVLGPSGSGKSTLARVLLGIWPEVQGEALLDGRPIQSWSRAELGPHIGYLPQDIELFDGTVAENIARFAEVDSAKVIAAAKAAGLHDMLLRLPKGYDTPIGEAGNMLSGGQRQRIGLARALYGDPVILILDEPNASLDEAGEQALLRAVQTAKSQHKTVLLITHRPGLVAVADQLIILRDGQIQAQGPQKQVLAQLQAMATTTLSPQRPA
jgi:ATP-binding cassette subfamily C exporter for protease/lipase